MGKIMQYSNIRARLAARADVLVTLWKAEDFKGFSESLKESKLSEQMVLIASVNERLDMVNKDLLIDWLLANY